MRLVRDGLSNRQIVTGMHYSRKTIEVYLSRVYAKTGYTSRLELIRPSTRVRCRSAAPADRVPERQRSRVAWGTVAGSSGVSLVRDWGTGAPSSPVSSRTSPSVLAAASTRRRPRYRRFVSPGSSTHDRDSRLRGQVLELGAEQLSLVEGVDGHEEGAAPVPQTHLAATLCQG